MPAPRLATVDYASPDLVVFVTIRAHPLTAPFGDPRVCQVIVDALEWLRSTHGVAIYAYALMPDHLHVLLRLGDSGRTLGSLIGAMKSYTTRRWWELGYRGMLWQERFHDHVVRRGEDATEIARYTLANPERAGLVEEGEAWEWRGMPDPM